MTNRVRRAGILAGVLLTACTPVRPAADSTDMTVALGEPFTLAAGQTASVTGEPLAISFGRVLEDSRCPADVQCVHAGDAVVAVVAQLRGDRAETLELHTHQQPRSVSSRGYTVELVTLAPQRRTDVAADTIAYSATLTVRKP